MAGRGAYRRTVTRTPNTAALPRPDRPGSRRASGVLFALGCLALLVTGAWLCPDADGHGTHEQLGLPACGWVSLFDRPCPTCGMTTSFAHAARGELWDSARTQPFGFALAMLAATGVWCGAHVAATGSRVLEHAARLVNPRTLALAAGALVGAWAYKLATWTA